MFHSNYKEVVAEEVKEEGAKRAKIRWLITEKEGAKNFCMRLFEIEEGGFTPWHKHDWEHEVFILEGKGKIITEKGEEELKPGDFLFVPPMEYHQFKNDSKEKLVFLCMIPIK